MDAILATHNIVFEADLDNKRPSHHTTDNSVNLWGRPSNKYKTGGWKAVVFIYALVTAETMSIIGLSGNLVTYLMFTLYMTEAHAANTTTNYIGVNYLLPVFWGFVADSYLGRYLTISMSNIIALMGLVTLTVQSSSSSLLPKRCDTYPLCPEPSGIPKLMLLSGLFLVAVGSAGIKPTISSLGQDQFDEGDPEEKKKHPHFFTYYYTFANVGTMLGFTLLVWIETSLAWKWAFGALTCFVLVGVVAFFIGTPFYRHQKTKGSSLTRLAQVFVVALKNYKLPLPLDSSDLYELSDKDYALRSMSKVAHTNRLRWLDRAAIKSDMPTEFKDGGRAWRVCTVTQVEDLKAVLHLLPIWMTNIAVYSLFANVMSFTVGQGNSMQRQVGRLIIPPASAAVFIILAAFVTLGVWEMVVEPVAKRFRSPAPGQPALTPLERKGVGMLMGVASIVVAALVERRRVSVIRAHGLNYVDLLLGRVPMSVFTLVPQYFLLGACEFVLGIAQLNFFFQEVPEGMKSLGTSFFYTSVALGYFLATILVTNVNRYTGGSGPGWLEAGGIEDGGLEKYYWLLAGIVTATTVAFFALARRYTYKAARSVQ